MILEDYLGFRFGSTFAMFYAMTYLLVWCTLAFAAKRDKETYTVSNWLVFSLALMGIPLLFMRYSIWEWLMIPPTFIMAYAWWKAGYWGGGDAKLIMALSLVLGGLLTMILVSLGAVIAHVRWRGQPGPFLVPLFTAATFMVPAVIWVGVG